MNATLENKYAMHCELARKSLEVYSGHMNAMWPVGHHKLLIDRLEAIERGDLHRLMVFMPPGHAKSTYASILFPAWFVGRNPKKLIICASYSDSLSQRFGRKVRNQVMSRYWPFPDVTLSDSTKAKGEWETNQGGEYFAVGVGGGVSGRRCHLGLIDDPIKGREDADSEVIREKTWEWYLSDFRTRLLPTASIALIQTRWHEDDLAGRILPESYAGESGPIQARDGEVWEVINLPALARDNDYLGREPGEPLWPEFYTKEKLEAEMRAQGPRNWNALYMGSPAPEEGDYFKREWFRFYDPENTPKYLKVYGASDYAVTENGGDYTEHGVVGVDPEDNIYFLDWWYGQTSSDVWVEKLLELARAWHPIQWAEEAGQINKSMDPFIRKRMHEEKVFFYRKQYPSSSDKPTRAQAFRGRAANCRIYLPKGKEWADRLLKQLLSFPAGRYDDAVDVCSLIGRMLAEMLTGKVPEPKEEPRFFAKYDKGQVKTELTFNELRDMNSRRKN